MFVVVTDSQTGKEVDEGILTNENDKEFSVMNMEFESTVIYNNIYYTYRKESRG